MGSCPSKTLCPNLGGVGEEFYSNGSRVELLVGLGCMQGLQSYNPVGLRWFFWNEKC